MLLLLLLTLFILRRWGREGGKEESAKHQALRQEDHLCAGEREREKAGKVDGKV